jgi:hypothetical protein
MKRLIVINNKLLRVPENAYEELTQAKLMNQHLSKSEQLELIDEILEDYNQKIEIAGSVDAVIL